MTTSRDLLATLRAAATMPCQQLEVLIGAVSAVEICRQLDQRVAVNDFPFPALCVSLAPPDPHHC